MHKEPHKTPRKVEQIKKVGKAKRKKQIIKRRSRSRSSVSQRQRCKNCKKNPYFSQRCFHFVGKMANQLGSLVESIKSKVRALKKNSNKPYIKMDKSSSVKVEIRSRKARKLIDKTLKAADRPGKRTLS
ncbi:hypothetical protein V6N13_089736 [Hibiscus sabdariffa]